MKKVNANSESPKSEEETDGDKVKYFSWTKIENRITKPTLAIAFEDAAAKMKEKLIDKYFQGLENFILKIIASFRFDSDFMTKWFS